MLASAPNAWAGRECLRALLPETTRAPIGYESIAPDRRALLEKMGRQLRQVEAISPEEAAFVSTLTPNERTYYRIWRHTFEAERGLTKYQLNLGNEFIQDLASLGPGGHLVDMGSGEGVAIRDLFSPPLPEEIQWQIAEDRSTVALNHLGDPDSWEAQYRAVMKDNWELRSRKNAGTPFATGISLATKRDPWLELNADARSKVHFLTGRMFEQIDDSEIIGRFGKADIISDLWGILAYSPDPGLTLERYFRILKPGGRIYSAGISDLIQLGEREISFGEWLQLNPGIKVEFLRESALRPQSLGRQPPLGALRITKKAEVIHFPRLTKTPAAARTGHGPGWISQPAF
jgi:hypothetical protein